LSVYVWSRRHCEKVDWDQKSKRHVGEKITGKSHGCGLASWH
jgi:hypothetical protein